MVSLGDIFCSYDKIKVESSNDNAFNYALNDWSNYSQVNLSATSTPLFLLFPLSVVAITSPLTLFNQCEVYFEDKCIGYYDLDNIDQENHKVSYNLRLFDKSALPEKFDFHFEKFDSQEQVKKMFFSGVRVFVDKKMIIDKK